MNALTEKVEATVVSDWTFQFPVSESVVPDRGWIADSPTASTEAELMMRNRFQQLVSQWKRDTAHHSILAAKLSHPAYQEIMRMGDIAVPMILAELERAPDHWFWALHFLTGEQPLPDDFAGTVDDAAALWVDWGRQRGRSEDARKAVTWAFPQTQAF